MLLKNNTTLFSKEKTIIILGNGEVIFSTTISRFLQITAKIIIISSIFYMIFAKIKLNKQSTFISKISMDIKEINSKNEKLNNELETINDLVKTIAGYFDSNNIDEKGVKKTEQIKHNLAEKINLMENIIEETGIGKYNIIQNQLHKIHQIKNTALENQSSISIISKQIQQLILLEKIMDSIPIRSPFMCKFRQTSKFGLRVNPINNKVIFHKGVDLAANLHAKIHSTAKGVIIFAGNKGSYGKMVEIDHGNNITTVYAHLAEIFVKKDQAIDKNTPIGIMGNSGRSTSPHLHYEIKINKEYINPIKFLMINKNEMENI